MPVSFFLTPQRERRNTRLEFKLLPCKRIQDNRQKHRLSSLFKWIPTVPTIPTETTSPWPWGSKQASVTYCHHLYNKEIIVRLALVNAVRTLSLAATASSDHLLSAKYSSLSGVSAVIRKDAEIKMIKILLCQTF